MEAVKAFNIEMASMLDTKPPISRAKMMSITKAGMKAIKLYKHVVQIIEKFIKKCNPELKVPGLYVVDSIIRQSRHQFGEDKDVFGPRFLKNISATFQSLYECPPDDKDKILRVLSLWQKNSVFSMDVIQPLMDMASAPVVAVMENGGTLGGSPAEAVCVQPTPEPSTLPVSQNAADQQNNVTLAAVAQFLQSAQGLDLQQILRTLQQGGATQANTANSASTANTANMANTAPAQQNSSISKVLQDRFEYDEEPDVEEPQQMERFPASSIKLADLQHALQGRHLSNQALPLTQIEQIVTKPDNTTTRAIAEPHTAESGHSRRDDRERRYSRRSRSRSPRRRSSSRSRSHSRHSRYRRSRSRSRERRRSPPRSRAEDRREMERRNKGFPPVKRETLSVCSTTLWLGQLDKKTQQQDVSSLMEEFGQIESINMIPPRGCAYIVMVHRQDAYTALNKLSRGNAKINHKSFKIAWAMNKGVGGRFKKHWNMELGVTYIPWEKLKDAEIVGLREGAVLDQETLKPEWASMLAELVKPVGDGGEGPEREREGGAAVASQVSAVSTESGVERTHTLPVDPVEPPSENSISGPGNQTGPLPLNHPPVPFMPPFPNVLRPPPNLPPPNVPRAPMFRIRLPMPGPSDPAEEFPHPGIMEAERWNDRPFRNDWQENGPPRGPPEWSGPEPPFRHSGWSRGGHWGHGQFRN
ncbi:SR-related and CTD-associated factor 4b isoform X1 [Pangasianodon hypophthalmus]|uniref:SR-related and CTD-associated factor 4b isoform X1 n=1 Tax=Pangasianodon hypophthalmus TaxID=310915 RepID=UPI002307C304|nr:SR-related and CTD-associated factor 4b isoform X1 [Pangasianodon hypophthalmus]